MLAKKVMELKNQPVEKDNVDKSNKENRYARKVLRNTKRKE